MLKAKVKINLPDKLLELPGSKIPILLESSKVCNINALAYIDTPLTLKSGEEIVVKLNSNISSYLKSNLYEKKLSICISMY